MGGMVGQGLAIRHPELVRGLVLANTAARYPAPARATWDERFAKIAAGGLAAIADLVIERYFHAGFRAAEPETIAAARQTLLRSDLAGYVGCAKAVADVDWLDRLGAVRCPTLVIAGALDTGTPVALAEATAGAIPGARLVVIDEASHLSALEQPAAFEAAVRRFLNHLPAGMAAA